MDELSSAGTEVLTEAETAVYRCLTREPLHIDQLTRACKLGSAQVNSLLVQLELRGLVKRFPGQLYLKVK
jgi:DNA processing protein